MEAQIGLDRFVQQNFGSDSFDPAERLEGIAFFVGQCDLCGGHDRPFHLRSRNPSMDERELVRVEQRPEEVLVALGSGGVLARVL